MQPFKTYRRIVIIDVDVSKNLVIDKLFKFEKAKSIATDVFTIYLKPTMIDAFAPRGTINIEMKAIDNSNKTTLICKIDSITQKSGYYSLVFILILWSLFSLFFWFKTSTIITVVIGWSLIFIVSYISHLLNKVKLDKYFDDLIQRIKRV